ncbi:hypothetical protein KR222_006629, partial [Zaprionus bogoriensis]
SRYSASTIMNSYRKELILMEYDIVGFDLDGTLLRYELMEMTTLIYDSLKEYMVTEKGYSPALLELPIDLDFMQKGLVLDGPRGNVIKLSNEAIILRASHGTRMLSDDEIVEAYGPERRWCMSDAFYNDPMSTWNGLGAIQMRALLDYFDMPAVLVFAQAVDLVDKASGSDCPPPNDYKVWEHLRDGMMHTYSRDNFSNDKSLYFKGMRADPKRYILRSSLKLLSWLQELRRIGKKTFLLTGSNIDFANLTATTALGNDWLQLFDFVVTYAKKPGFFMEQRQFLRTDLDAEIEVPGSELSLQAELQPGVVYSKGNWQQLHRSLAKQLKKEPCEARALYFGDNIIQDVYTPVKHGDFDSVAVAEELLPMEQADYPFKAAHSSKCWGSYFFVDSTPTIWSGFIANYAQICVSSMDRMAQMSPCERIVCTNSCGFYPSLPAQLSTSNVTSCWHG